MIKATKNGVERKFTDTMWNRLPKHKYGWIPVSDVKSAVPVPEEIVKKKIVPEEVAAPVVEEKKPEELIIKKPEVKKAKTEIPEELKVPVKPPKKNVRAKK